MILIIKKVGAYLGIPLQTIFFFSLEYGLVHVMLLMQQLLGLDGQLTT